MEIDDKLKKMEDEMSRFEAEISGRSGGFGFPNAFGNIPPPPMLIPHQVVKNAKATGASISGPSLEPYPEPIVQPVVLSGAPKIYTNRSSSPPVSNIDIHALQAEVEKKLKKLKPEKVSMAAEVAISQGKASSALQSFGMDEYRRRGSKNKKLMRTAGGHVWEDLTLADWSDDDFRIFCGDLGNDVTDELLTRTFNKFPSFLKARVIRDKRTNKSKGYGFVSFKDPADFTKAMKEMNGRYVGSRPIKLRKSTWKSRNIDLVRKKEKEKAALISMLTTGR